MGFITLLSLKLTEVFYKLSSNLTIVTIDHYKTTRNKNYIYCLFLIIYNNLTFLKCCIFKKCTDLYDVSFSIKFCQIIIIFKLYCRYINNILKHKNANGIQKKLKYILQLDNIL